MNFSRKAGIILAVIFGTGIILRLLFYLANRSLWLDELFVAFNANEGSFPQIFLPLGYQQCTPVGFILYEKLFVLSLGNNEYSLRLFPLLCGLAGLGYFWILAKRLCTRYSSAVIALAFFSFSRLLIYFSAETKQYSSDVMITILLFLLFIRHSEIKTARVANRFLFFSFGVTGIFAILLSHTAIFTLTGYSLISMLQYYKQRESKKLISLMGSCAVWLLASSILYKNIYHAYFTNPYLQDCWKTNFINFSPSFFKTASLFFENVVRISCGNVGRLWGSILFISGALCLLRNEKHRLLVLTSPLIVCFFASALRYYPIEERLLLFFAPPAIIIVSEGVNYYRAILERRSVALANIFLGLIIVFLLTDSLGLITNPSEETSCRPRQESKPVIEYIAKHKQAGDLMYAFAEAQYAFKYYGRNLGIEKYSVVDPSSKGETYEKTFAPLRNKDRTWILFTYYCKSQALFREKQEEIAYLDIIGKRLDTYKKQGATAYLYDFSQ